MLGTTLNHVHDHVLSCFVGKWGQTIFSLKIVVEQVIVLHLISVKLVH